VRLIYRNTRHVVTPGSLHGLQAQEPTYVLFSFEIKFFPFDDFYRALMLQCPIFLNIPKCVLDLMNVENCMTTFIVDEIKGTKHSSIECRLNPTISEIHFHCVVLYFMNLRTKHFKALNGFYRLRARSLAMAVRLLHGASSSILISSSISNSSLRSGNARGSASSSTALMSLAMSSPG
jgi:hypothetical protein